jgi:hypothetical protein
MIAEFWNTMSSLALCLASSVVLWHCAKYRLERRWAVTAFFFFCIGVGSVSFHGTLSRWGQGMDELSMVRMGVRLWTIICL